MAPIPVTLSPIASFTLLDGSFVDVIGAHVESMSSVPAELLPTGATDGTYLDLSSGIRLAVQGQLLIIGLAVKQAIQPLCSCGQQP